MRCSVLLYQGKLDKVAGTCCSVLQCVAVYLVRSVFSALQCVAVFCCINGSWINLWVRVAVRCSALQCVAVRCNALQCDVVRCSTLLCVSVSREVG